MIQKGSFQHRWLHSSLTPLVVSLTMSAVSLVRVVLLMPDYLLTMSQFKPPTTILQRGPGLNVLKISPDGRLLLAGGV